MTAANDDLIRVEKKSNALYARCRKELVMRLWIQGHYYQQQSYPLELGAKVITAALYEYGHGLLRRCSWRATCFGAHPPELFRIAS